MRAVRLISFRIDEGPPRAGICDGEIVHDTGLGMRDLLARGIDRVRPISRHPRAAVQPLPAVPDPGKIMCIGRNYREHATEQGAEAPAQPLVFAKYPSALISDGEPIRLSPLTSQVDWEAELVVVIGRAGKRIGESSAWKHVAGYTVMNDVSARDLQRGDGQWTRAKSLDTFAPLAAELVSADEIHDPVVVFGGPSQRVKGVAQCLPQCRVSHACHGIALLRAPSRPLLRLRPRDLPRRWALAGRAPLRP